MASEQSRLDAAAASILAAYTAKQIASGGHEVWPPELAAQMRVDDMRAAILVALPVLLGEVAEVVGEMTDYIDQEVDPELDVVERWRDQMRSYLNAPSLGEGDGR